MINNISLLNDFFKKHNYPRYEKDNFLAFLKKNKFSFALPVIHIAGTNGKGSTLNYLKNIYVKAGYQVGAFTSPFFNEVNEMILINFQKKSNEDLLSLFNEHYQDFIKFDLSSFEIQTFLALKYFSLKEVDLVILEAGMGGELDATNITHNELAIITSVSLEHTNYLGRSVSEIALSKGGIIKYKSRVLISHLEESAKNVIFDLSKLNKASFYEVGNIHELKILDYKLSFDYDSYKNLTLNSLAKYQTLNASLAIEATKILNDLFPVKEEDIIEGLLINSLEGRFEIINDHLILDGAHNIEAVNLLLETLEEVNDKPIHFLFACLLDKNHTLMLNLLARDASSITLTTFDHERARKEEDYFIFLEDYPFYENYLDAINYLRNTYPDDLIVVTGSLTFVNIVRKALKK